MEGIPTASELLAREATTISRRFMSVPVYTPFYRSPRAEAQAKGIGLRLAVCKRVMEAQGGTIRAVTRPEGGCDFIFTVKRYERSRS